MQISICCGSGWEKVERQVWTAKDHKGNRGERNVYYFNCDYSFIFIYVKCICKCIYIKMDHIVLSIYSVIVR